MPLPMFTSSRPVPQQNLGYEVARRDLHSLEPVQEVIQQLQHGGLTGMDLLQTFFSHQVQSLHRWVMTM
jgi:hypothetical protein